MGGQEAACLVELQLVNRVASSLGQSALFLARAIDTLDRGEGVDSGSSKASLVRHLTATMALATRVAEGAKGDELDDLEDEVAAARARAAGA